MKEKEINVGDKKKENKRPPTISFITFHGSARDYFLFSLSVDLLFFVELS